MNDMIFDNLADLIAFLAQNVINIVQIERFHDENDGSDYYELTVIN